MFCRMALFLFLGLLLKAQTTENIIEMVKKAELATKEFEIMTIATNLAADHFLNLYGKKADHRDIGRAILRFIFLDFQKNIARDRGLTYLERVSDLLKKKVQDTELSITRNLMGGIKRRLNPPRSAKEKELKEKMKQWRKKHSHDMNFRFAQKV